MIQKPCVIGSRSYVEKLVVTAAGKFLGYETTIEILPKNVKIGLKKT
jgi:hypothetical protein